MNPTKKRILKRAKISLLCLPFSKSFYSVVKDDGLNSKNVYEFKRKYLKKGSLNSTNATSIESDFIWLIAVGILRREVDGQGLTAKVRLTPLGRQAMNSYPDIFSIKANLAQKLNFCIQRILIFK